MYNFSFGISIIFIISLILLPISSYTQSPQTEYWQQEVNYSWEANIHPNEGKIESEGTITYKNNSPHKIKKIYFHLYQNAFQPGSHLDDLNKANKISQPYGTRESAKRGTQIESIYHNGRRLNVKVDNTIASIELPFPLLPGESAGFHVKFETWFDESEVDRRMDMYSVPVKRPDGTTYRVKHLNGVHWYPRVAVFDRKKGWNIDQHLGKEFYGDFGTFEVNLTLPGNYILDATGVLQNSEEVMPATLRNQLDIKNFKEVKFGSTANELIPEDVPDKTWKFRAENVHDFAFTADPTYRIGEADYKDIKCIALAQECHASGWQDAAAYAAKCIEVYSVDFGQYQWPKIIVADARDGMEYPMLTLDGGKSPTYKGLLAHEIGHQWFYGMVASNETHRAFMDEGFTQFLTAWALKRLVGDTIFRKDMEVNTYYGRNYYNYLDAAISGYDATMNTHSHDFHGALSHENGYVLVYYKTATMFRNLEYMIGTERLREALAYYFDKWKFKHPYPNDFRQAMADYLNMDLTWFFDQWLESEKKLDYAIKKVATSDGGKTAKITFERKERMTMPIDFSVITKSGDTLNYLIPNTPEPSKSEENRTILPYWLGFDQLNPTYTAEIEVPDKIKKVIIDPTQRLGDLNLLNNQSGCMPVKVSFSLLPQPDKYYPIRDKYHLKIRPDVFYNSQNGVQAGVNLKGDYFYRLGKLDASFWVGTGLLANEAPTRITDNVSSEFSDQSYSTNPLSYQVSFTTPIRKLGRGLDIQLNSAFRNGLWKQYAGFSKKWATAREDNPDYKRVFGGYKYMKRRAGADELFNFFPDRFNAGQPNAYFLMGFEKGYPLMNGNGKWKVTLRSTSLGSASKYAALNFESRYDVKISKFDLRYRLFAQYADGEIPLESALYMSEGNPEAMADDLFYQARGFVPEAFLDNDNGRQTYNSQFTGGLALRGYAGYKAEFEDGTPEWVGNHGAALNLEFEFNRLIPLRPAFLSKFFQFHSYLFYDAGIMGRRIEKAGFDGIDLGRFRMDGGIGFALDLQDKRLIKSQPITLRLDLPLWLSRPPATEEFVQFRWLLAIGRAF